MTDSEASAPQDDSDEDIYKDFPAFNLEEELAKLEGSKESYKQEALDLSEKVKVLTEENKELKKLNEVLGKNISSLLKTAQTEVHRKDSLIEELRSKVDSFTFRRLNRFGKDKFTTTEDLEPVNNFKSECLECKKNRNNIRSRSKSKSYENRTSSGSESKSSKGDTRKSDRYYLKEESKDCDNEKRLGHFRDNLKLNYKHSRSDHDPFIDKQRGSQFNRYSRRESIVGRRSYRQDDRHHSKCDSDKRGYNKRDSNEPRFSVRRRDSDKRRRDDSPEKLRRSDTRRNRSRSRNRTDERKESLSDKGKSRGSLESDSLMRSRQDVRNKSKESESTRNNVKSDESNKRTECSERSKTIAKVSDKSKQVTKDRNSVKSEGRRNPDSFETKSPLDALYNEMIVTRSTTRLSNPKTGSTKTDSELEEGEYVEEKLEQPGSSDESDEWVVPSKNEKPVTLYTKRMMERISAEQILEKGRESKQTGDGEGKNVSDERVESRMEETNVKDSMETGREPGELTDDENVIESSKEFQEIAKVASAVDNKIIKKPGKDDRKKVPEPGRVFFKEPFKTAPNNNAICNSVVTETKERRDIIEFSPFKNNYKLIEISPVKPPKGEHILDVYNKRLPSNAQTQKEVESKIFNLIMSLSRAPSESNKSAEKTVSEGNEAQEIPADRGEHQPEPVEKPETRKKISSDEKTDEKKHESSSRRTNNRKSSKSKQVKAQDKPEKEKRKTSITEDEVVDSVTPGETTQFLDFFLRTTSPSKPIVPAEQEMEMKGKQENGELDPTGSKSDGKENSTTVVNTSSEKESLNSSSSEIQGKESHSKAKSPKSTNSKSKKPTKSPLKKRNSNSKKDSKENEMVGERKRERERSTESKKKGKPSEVKADVKNGSNDEASRGRNKRKVDAEDGENQSREEKGLKRKRTTSERDEETKKQKLEDGKTSHKKRRKRDSKSEPEERSGESIKEDITSFEFFKPITRIETGEKSGEEDANKSNGDYKMTTTMSLTGVVCLETPNKCVEKVMINEQAIYHFMDSKANTTYSPMPSCKYPEMTPRRMLKNDLTLTDSDEDNKPNQDEVDDDEAEAEEEDEEEEGVVVEDEGEVEMSENENSDSDSDSGASAFVDLL